jgi:hypothetical protein
MKISKSALQPQDVVLQYYSWAESILQAMIISALKGNLPVVFILNRPLFEACLKGLRICMLDPSKLAGLDADLDLPRLAAEIDEVIDQRFTEWGAPFINPAVGSRYAGFLESSTLKALSDGGDIKPSSVLERLHNDTHGTLPTLEYYRNVQERNLLRRSAKELCAVGWDPFLLHLRFAISKRFPHGPINDGNLLDVTASPLGLGIKQVLEMSD